MFLIYNPKYNYAAYNYVTGYTLYSEPNLAYFYANIITKLPTFSW